MKKILSEMIVLSIVLSCSQNLVGANSVLSYAGKTETPIAGAIEETPEKYLFTYDEKSFIVLDTKQEGEKQYFFVLADNTYGMKKFDLGRSNAESLAYWNVNDELNIANWLNNDFFESGNGSYALPENIKKYIDEEHVWTTEPLKTLEGYTSAYTNTAPLAFLSDYEWQKYIEKIGQNVAKNWWLRTAKSDMGESNQVLVTGSGCDLGTNETWRANGTPCYVRPAFFLDSEFFANEKISDIGGEVATLIAPYLNRDLYTDEELDAIYPRPSAVINGIKGSKRVGDTISVDYTYNSNISELGTEIKWYMSDKEDEGFDDPAGEGKELVLTEKMSGKYLIVSVTPKSASSISAPGSTVYSESFGPIFGKKEIQTAISELKSAQEPFEVLKKYFYIFETDVSESLDDVSNAEKIFLSIDFESVETVASAYNFAVTIQKLNETQNDSDVIEILSKAGFDVEGYEENYNSEQVLTLIKTNNFSDYKDFVTNLSKTVIAAAFSGKTETQVIELLASYDTIAEVKNLSSTEIKRLASKLTETTFSSFDELKSKIKAEADKIINNRADLSDEKMLGLTSVGRTATPISTAVENTPENIKFKIDDKEFAVLDKIRKNEKNYYFVICEDSYGTAAFDRTPGISAEQSVGVWNPEDENNIAYWLNNEFLSDGNQGKKLPEKIKEYIDYQHIWHTEPFRALEEYKTEMLSVSGLSLLAVHEWKEYIHLIGQNTINGTYMMRTARTLDVTVNNIVLGTGSSIPLGTNTGIGTTSSTAHIRPVFYLDEDFFKNAKLQTAGEVVALYADNILDKSLYTKEELDKVVTPPMVSQIQITGDAIVGEKLGVSYKYDGIFDEADTVIKWYIKNNSEADFVYLAQGDEITLTEDHADKQIKVSVTPVSKSKANPCGYETMSEGFAVVYGTQKISEMLLEINNAAAEELGGVLDKYSDILYLDTALSEFEEESKKRIYESLAKMNFTDVTAVKEGFYAHTALERVNLADEKKIEEMLLQEDLGINTEFYKRIEDKTILNKLLAETDFNDIEYFRTEVFTLVALEEFNNSDRTDIKTLIKDYADIFSKDVTSYSDYELGRIGVYMIDVNYNTLTDIDNAFSNGVSKLSQGNYNGGTSGGSGGSSSGSGGGKSTGISGVSASAKDNVYGKTETEKMTEKFSDLDEALWAKDMILALSEKNIISGYEDGTFRPNKLLTREEFVTIIVHAFEMEAKDETIPFKDVSQNDWYYENVKAAYTNGIISGISENEFGVGEYVSREDMMTILYRISGNAQADTNLTFDDSEEISEYAREAVSYMVSNGFASGVGNNKFEPKTPTTRAMAARMVASILG